MSTTLKSVWAVVAGFLAVAVLSIVTDKILESTGVFPPATEGLFVTWMLVLALAYRSAYAVLGGYITSYLAPQNKMKHVWILSYIGLAGALIGLIGTWNMNLGPHWYPILLAVFTIPCVWLGGYLQNKKA